MTSAVDPERPGAVVSYPDDKAGPGCCFRSGRPEQSSYTGQQAEKMASRKQQAREIVSGPRSTRMTTTETFIANYGLLAVFLGGFLEGETVLILAAVAAHHGLLPLPMVFLVGTISATLGDQAWFMLARHRSQLATIQRMLKGARVQRALDLVQRHPTIFILSFRFIYGLRIAGALACGLSNIGAVRFAAFNFLAALIWNALILALGYGFGSAIEVFLGQARRIEWKIPAALAGLMLLFVVSRLVQRHWKR